MVISKYVEESAILVLSDLDEDEAVISDQISVQIVGLCLYGNPGPHQISLLLIFVGTWIANASLARPRYHPTGRLATTRRRLLVRPLPLTFPSESTVD